MNLYPYRYYIALLSIVSLTSSMCWLDFQPKFEAIYEAKKSIVALTEKLTDARRLSEYQMKQIVKAEKETQPQLLALERLFLLLHQHGLNLKSAYMPSKEKVNVVLEGSFLRWQSLVEALNQQTPALLVAHFSFKQAKIGDAIIKMDLIAQEMLNVRPNKSSHFKLSPICGETKAHDSPKKSYPVSQMKVKATVKDNKQARALVLLPNNKTSEVKVGDHIGEELATVLEIHPNEVVVELKGKRIHL